MARCNRDETGTPRSLIRSYVAWFLSGVIAALLRGSKPADTEP